MVHDILVCCEQAIIAADFVLGVSCLSLNYFSELTSIGAGGKKKKRILPSAWDRGSPSLWEQRFGASGIVMKNPSYLVAAIAIAEG